MDKGNEREKWGETLMQWMWTGEETVITMEDLTTLHGIAGDREL